MKKLMLLSLAGAVSFGAFAQNTTKGTVTSKQVIKPAVALQASTEAVQAPAPAAAKGAVMVSRWYNHAETSAKANGLSMEDLMDGDHSSFGPLWQDSTVFYPESTDGISFLSMAQLFDPFADTYNDLFVYPAETPDILRLNKTTPYKLDSVSLLGRYERAYPGYVDTLIFTFVNESSAMDFFYTNWVGATDSFAFLLWSSSDYNNVPINQVSYGTSAGSLGSAVRIKVPLDDALFADSMANGLHMISVAPNMNIPAGKKVSVSVTFKSGTTYTAGTEITDYNYYQFLSHEIIPNSDYTVIGNDNTMSYTLYKDSTNKSVNSSLSFYNPSSGYLASYGLDDHNISWKITANVLPSTSVASVNGDFTAEAYPNPANTSLNVPVTVKADANVIVNITNAVGQTVATQNLGKVAAGQKATAVFNTQSFANGVYFYTVEANGQRLTQRFAVSR